MIISVDMDGLNNEIDHSDPVFSALIFSLMERRPVEKFYLISERNISDEHLLPPNAEVIKIAPGKIPFLRKYLHKRRVQTALSKIKAEVYISQASDVTTKIPLCLVVQNEDPSSGSEKSKLEKNLHRAKTVIAFSATAKKRMVDRHKINPAKIHIVPPVPGSLFRSFEMEEKEAIKAQFTEGKEYFIYSTKNLSGHTVDLLKSFSIFKKRQQTSLKLLILCSSINDNVLQLLKTYKYKEDVLVRQKVNEDLMAELVGSAYAMIYSAKEAGNVSMIEAMAAGTPLLVPKTAVAKEITAEGGLYFEPGNIADLADKLMLIYKDENLRKAMIEKGKELASLCDIDRTAELFWECIRLTAIPDT
jgi:glycosyltransferase involved in cell wall biosynthesis